MKSLKVLILLLLVPWLLQAQTLKTSVFSSGGGISQGTGYSNFGTFGQPLSVGTMGTNYQNREGFIFAQQNILNVTITANETICNNTPASILNSDYTGAEGDVTFQWQVLNGTTWEDITGEKSDTYDPGNLTETSKFRLVMNDKSGVGEAISDTVTVTVYDLFSAGAIETTGESICYDGNPDEIGSDTDAEGGDETITYAWYSSTNDFTDSALISGATLSSYYPPTGLKETTSYRRYAKDATCNTTLELSSGKWVVTVEPTPVAGTLAKTPDQATVCEGDNVSATLTAGSGGNGTDSTYYRTKASSVWSSWTAYTSTSNVSTTGKTDVEVRTKRKGRACSDATWTTVSWTVEQTPVSGTLAKTPNTSNVCKGDNVSAVLTNGSGGNSVDSTYFRTHNGTAWSAWANYISGTNISTTDKTSVEIRTKRKASYCSDAAFNTASWSIHPRPNPFAGTDATISQLQTYTATTATASNHTDLLWETDGDGTFDDETSLDPVYTPGADDIVAGMVELCLTASPVSPCLSDSTDCLSLRICRCPSIVLSSPVHKQLLFANPVTITGTASDADNNLDLIEVRINGGSWQTATGTTSWSISLDLIPGKNSIEARATDLTSLQSGIEQVEVTLSVQVINIPQGWSFISSYLEPNDPNIVNMWADVVGANNLMILTGINGIYAPAPFYINTLNNWDVMKGYKVKMNVADDLIVSGDSLTDKTVNFPAGVHLIPVLTNQTTSLDMVFDSPSTDILYMLDIYSNLIYWPGGILYTLTDLVPGKGYLANFKNPVTLSYPPLSNFTVDNTQNLPPAPGPWVCIRTSNIHLISVSTEAISQLQNADYLGAFDSQGNCMGYASLEKSGTNLLLTIYGDEPITSENDGMLEGELIRFRSFGITENAEKELTASFNPTFPNDDGLFVINGLSGISGFKESATGVGENDLAASVLVYPNPATDELNISLKGFHPASAGLQGIGTLVTAEGKLVKTFEIKNNFTKVDINDLRPGLYVLKIESPVNIIVKRVIVE